ncbi:MAG: helix-turn-helix transcriptional regulator [Acidiferrobacteraceae bacterium]|jgi:DNA-binding HxlR family transcriptional regulator|nr:helix-turn-helix transcriptional regulator [Acidiferrobacteraceae bacterium]MBT5981741.1 helix-turn-helix transcriptional regulator [Acidiferrobacteraceae bacterium]
MKKITTTCPVERSLDIIGGKWKLCILSKLQVGPIRFGALKREMPDITQKMLTQQLRDLETAGLIHRKVYAEVPPKVEYSLTDFGHTLRPMVDFVSGWGIKNSEQINQALGALGRV